MKGKGETDCSFSSQKACSTIRFPLAVREKGNLSSANRWEEIIQISCHGMLYYINILYLAVKPQ